MRHVFSTFLCLAIFADSCKKTNPDDSISGVAKAGYLIPEGTYVGTFQRLTSTGGQISNVTIAFSANNWTGQSQFAKYPALCRGTYKAISADSASFENACFWTAEFDWTLILSQDYKIKLVGNNIEISRDYSSVYRDIYKLIKQ